MEMNTYMKESRMANSVIAVIIVLSERYNPVIAAVVISIVHPEIVTMTTPAALIIMGMEWETKENAVLLMRIVHQVLIASQIPYKIVLFVPIPLTRKESRLD